MSAFENICVIPIYISLIKIINKDVNLSWYEQTYIGINYEDAFKSAKSAVKEFDIDIIVEPVIRRYELLPDGSMRYIMEQSI